MISTKFPALEWQASRQCELSKRLCAGNMTKVERRSTAEPYIDFSESVTGMRRRRQRWDDVSVFIRESG